MGIQLIMTTVIASTVAATAPGCSWAHPGANPFRGDPAAALSDFAMADETRRKLRASMNAHRTTDVATITRDDITGRAGKARYGDLRQMHSGHGQVCHGAVDRSAWSTTRRERALVYCVDGTCVLVPTICNNVSLVTREPDEPVAGAGPIDDSPIDISPSAGPPGGGTPGGGTPGDGGPRTTVASAAPDAFIGTAPDDVASTSGAGSPGAFTGGGVPPYLGPIGAGGGAPGGTTGGGDVGNAPSGGATSGDTGSGGGGGGSTIPGTGNNPGGGIGGGCCAAVAPTTPATPSTPVSSVPEPAGDLLWLSGAAALLARRWRTRGARST